LSALYTLLILLLLLTYCLPDSSAATGGVTDEARTRELVKRWNKRTALYSPFRSTYPLGTFIDFSPVQQLLQNEPNTQTTFISFHFTSHHSLPPRLSSLDKPSRSHTDPVLLSARYAANSPTLSRLAAALQHSLLLPLNAPAAASESIRELASLRHANQCKGTLTSVEASVEAHD
jgi:hypothetical protein